MNQPTLLLFDLGGVLIENHGFEKINQFLSQPLGIDGLKEKWLSSSAVRRFELGKISPREFAIQFVSEWNFIGTPETFLTEFTCWPKGFYPQVLNLIRTLRQTYSVGCLSNSNSIHWERFGNLEDEFDYALSSHLIGAVKPDQKAFAAVIEKCNVQPELIYFFDDTPANVNAAKRMGIRGFHVNGIKELRQTLDSERLITRQ